MATMTPRALLERHVDDLIGFLPSLFDGEAESVHRARITARRLREVLPLAINPPDQRLLDVFRSVGRHLGRVRDLDVMRALLGDVAERVISTAGVAAVARQALRGQQLSERRSMVKALEEMDLEGLRRNLRAGGDRWTRWMNRPAALIRTPEWRTSLRAQITTRAAEATDAVRHATGIYLPNRAHRARIAVKKLRYSIELARETGIWQPRRVLKDLRRIQSTLGSIHDAQVLIDAVDDLVGKDAQPADVTALKRALDDDIAREHAEYMRTRDRVFAIADVCGRAVRSSMFRSPASLVAASVVALPLVVLGRRQVG